MLVCTKMQVFAWPSGPIRPMVSLMPTSRKGVLLDLSRSLDFAWLAYLALSALSLDSLKRNFARFLTCSLSLVIPVALPSVLVIKYCSLFVPPVLFARLVCALSRDTVLSYIYGCEKFRISDMIYF